MASIITRFPPSPTGYFHIGSARTALYNYLAASHEGGTLYLRFEDTDRERSEKIYEDDILEGLSWLGIAYTTPKPMRQSERLSVYQPYVAKLIESGAAYEAESSKDDPERKVVRFKNPNTSITFTDIIRGEVTFDTTELGDFVIARSIHEPLYHLAVVIDDHDMGVTHVVRGEDHISNTPRQILILEALGFTRPLYAHIPLILAPDKTKLSKRHGAVSINEYRAEGYIPEALINYLAFLGWNPGGEREIFSLQELASAFHLEEVHKGGAVFTVEKLRWFNKEHLKLLSNEAYIERLRQFMEKYRIALPSYMEKAVPIVRERAETLREAATLLTEECSFFGDIETPSAELLLKSAKASREEVSQHLKAVAHILENLPKEPWTVDEVKDALMSYATEVGRSSVLWPLRVALSGKERSPDPFTITVNIGRDTALSRIASALQNL